MDPSMFGSGAGAKNKDPKPESSPESGPMGLFGLISGILGSIPDSLSALAAGLGLNPIRLIEETINGAVNATISTIKTVANAMLPGVVEDSGLSPGGSSSPPQTSHA